MNDELEKALQSYMEAVKEYNNTVIKLSKQLEDLIGIMDVENKYRKNYEQYQNTISGLKTKKDIKKELAKYDCEVEYKDFAKEMLVSITDELNMPYEFVCLFDDKGKLIAVNF